MAGGLAYAASYHAVKSALRGPALLRGLRFGLISWALMAIWFEFYLPWNVLREPLPLVLLELACWLGVHLLTGVVTALVSAGLFRSGAQPA